MVTLSLNFMILYRCQFGTFVSPLAMLALFHLLPSLGLCFLPSFIPFHPEWPRITPRSSAWRWTTTACPRSSSTWTTSLGGWVCVFLWACFLPSFLPRAGWRVGSLGRYHNQLLVIQSNLG